MALVVGTAIRTGVRINVIRAVTRLAFTRAQAAQAFGGLTADRVRAAKDFLHHAGVTNQGGLHRRSILWKLAPQEALATALTPRLTVGEPPQEPNR